ncbi:MAG: hypothetical protein AB4058_05515 [Microcystaceae cyanobacterium]
MSINSRQPHLLILPEDDANHQIATGFRNNLNVDSRVIQVLGNAGGWEKVIKTFEKTHIAKMQKFRERRMILLIDFDKREDRLSYVI